MTQLFARLTLAVLLTLAAGQGSGFGVQGSDADDHLALSAHHALGSPSGQQLVAEAARRLQTEGSLSAELRYRIDAYGHKLTGSGTYLQFGEGAEKLLKLELRMPVGERAASLQEIRGEDFYYVRRDVPPDPPSLTRVNLGLLRDALRRPDAASAAEVLPQRGWILLGGLPQLLASLEQNFAFEPPRADELRFRTGDGQSVQSVPVWIVSGRWKPGRLAALIGAGPAKAGKLPEQLPERVELVLGRTEVIPPLFPCRITYWQAAGETAGGGSTSAAPARELLTLELYHVDAKSPIDRREFLYNPGDQDVRDQTAKYIERYSGAGKLR